MDGLLKRVNSSTHNCEKRMTGRVGDSGVRQFIRLMMNGEGEPPVNVTAG